MGKKPVRSNTRPARGRQYASSYLDLGVARQTLEH
jgi:hypothetical protein